MTTRVELILTPAELSAREGIAIDGRTCVVFDILRATSTIATALANGARGVTVVGEISEAMNCRLADEAVLLAGERNGRRITAEQTGSIEFDLGNSPREFTRDRVSDRNIVMTTTNGTRALKACHGAASILSASFLNLTATAETILESRPPHLQLIAAGTGDRMAFEDVLGAGALLARLPADEFSSPCDASLIALELYERHRHDLTGAFARSRNGKRLLADPALAEDVAFCAQQDRITQPVFVEDHTARIGS